MSPRRRTVFAVGVAVTVAVFLVTVPAFRHFFDLGVYLGAVRHWLVAGGDLYDFRYDGTEYGFTYPPFAALVMSPLALLSRPVAVAASIAANAVAVGLLLRWFLWPALRRLGRPAWTSWTVAFCVVLVFEPVRDTFSVGQVNLILLVLVVADLRLLRAGHGRAGVLLGLAAAIKLTPAIFIGYLLITRRWRAAAVATGTAASATLVTAVVAADESAAFWAGAVWDTGRVGDLAYVSNQSLRGVVARLDAGALWWVAAACFVLALWWVRARRAADSGDHTTGFALTGIAGCLLSPVTWVHHLVWLLPALFLLLDAALGEPDRRRRHYRLAGVAAIWVVLSSSVVWLWWGGVQGWTGTIGSNTYVWISIGLLLLLPVRVTPALLPAARSQRGPVPDPT